MAALTRTDVSNVRIFDLNACKSALDAVSDVNAKFKLFDELTDEGLDSVTLDVLKYIGNDPQNLVAVFQTHFDNDGIEETIAKRVYEAIMHSQALSDHMMQSIGNEGKRKLASVCSNVNTYIHTKLFYTMHNIVAAPTYGSVFINQANPLRLVTEAMWRFMRFHHKKECPCYHRIQGHLAANAQKARTVEQVVLNKAHVFILMLLFQILRTRPS